MKLDSRISDEIVVFSEKIIHVKGIISPKKQSRSQIIDIISMQYAYLFRNIE